MRFVLDTNVVRRLATGEIFQIEKGNEEVWEVTPGSIVELLTRLDETNIDLKRRAARFILEKKLDILPLPPAYLLRELELIDSTEVDHQERHFKKILQDFVAGKDVGFLMPSGITFEDYRTQIAADYTNGLPKRRETLFENYAADSQKLKEMKGSVAHRLKPKWHLVLKTIENISVLVPGFVSEDRINLKVLEEMVEILEVYFDITNYTSMNEISRSGKVDPNDSLDLMLFYYIGPKTMLVTGDQKWIRNAEACGHEDKVVPI